MILGTIYSWKLEFLGTCITLMECYFHHLSLPLQDTSLCPFDLKQCYDFYFIQTIFVACLITHKYGNQCNEQNLPFWKLTISLMFLLILAGQPVGFVWGALKSDIKTQNVFEDISHFLFLYCYWFTIIALNFLALCLNLSGL